MTHRFPFAVVAACATIILAPAVAPAQTLARTWTVAGCDDAHADVLGPGPRLCGSARLELWSFGFPSPSPYEWTGELRVRDVVLDGRSGFVGSSYAYGNYGFVFTGGQLSGRDLMDSGFAHCWRAVCRGRVGEIGAWILASGDIDVQAMTIGVRYVPNWVPTGYDTMGAQPVPLYASRLVMQTVPEPATVVTTAVGLGALALGAWRRRARRS